VFLDALYNLCDISKLINLFNIVKDLTFSTILHVPKHGFLVSNCKAEKLIINDLKLSVAPKWLTNIFNDSGSYENTPGD